MNRYEGKAFCSGCQKWIPIEQLLKVYIRGVGKEVYYCKIHRKQVRLKARGTPMSTVIGRIKK